MFFLIHNMAMLNTVRYLSAAPGAEDWGVVVTGAGLSEYPAHTAYPYKTHPSDHLFTWESGRALASFQVLILLRGAGQIEGKGVPLQKVGVGDVVLLTPRTWHRYRPDPGTGWTELWVEFSGPLVDKLNAKGDLGPALMPRANVGGDLEAAMRAAHHAVQSALPGVNPELSAQGLRLLSLLHRLTHARKLAPGKNEPLHRVIQQLEKEYRTSPDLKKLAKSAGVPYSSFRRKFQELTGFSPWQYVLHLRMEHARRSLLASDVSMEALASELGFSSSFHFSAAFKRHTGTAPSKWRRKMGALRRA